jgi:hypothetical protein
MDLISAAEPFFKQFFQQELIADVPFGYSYQLYLPELLTATEAYSIKDVVQSQFIGPLLEIEDLQDIDFDTLDMIARLHSYAYFNRITSLLRNNDANRRTAASTLQHFLDEDNYLQVADAQADLIQHHPRSQTNSVWDNPYRAQNAQQLAEACNGVYCGLSLLRHLEECNTLLQTWQANLPAGVVDSFYDQTKEFFEILGSLLAPTIPYKIEGERTLSTSSPTLNGLS